MPSRNIVKEFASDQFYHLYNRGVEKRAIFLDDQDYIVFLGLLKKYLTGKSSNQNNRHVFTSFDGKVELIAYCLMRNHFHLLFYQTTADGISQLMRRVSTGYVMYFNQRYGRKGGLFESIYKASHINEDAYLHHISRYIHLNPHSYKEWPYSSYQSYTGEKRTEWIKPDRVLDLFKDRDDYVSFVADYVDTQADLSLLKWQLANELEDED